MMNKLAVLFMHATVSVEPAVVDRWRCGAFEDFKRVQNYRKINKCAFRMH